MKNKKTIKLMVLGHKRHGKDTVSEYIQHKYGLTFTSSSMFVAEKLIQPIMKYPTVEQCFDDRVNHRKFWYDTIKSYNTQDPARLAKEVYSQYDIYCGLRDLEEFEEIKRIKLFDLSIWIDRSEHLPLESIESFNIPKSKADIIIDNNGTLDELYDKVDSLMKVIS